LTFDNNTGGIVLAGGASRRMGQNKALMRLSPEKPSLIETVVAKLQGVTAGIWIVTNQAELYQHLDFPGETKFVADNYIGGGALAGIEAGLSASKYEYCIISACDLPFLAENLLNFLVNYNRNGWQALVPLNVTPEPLCAVYRKTALAVLRQCLEQRKFKVQDFLAQVQTQYLAKEEWETFDPQGQSFWNLNTLDDLERAKLSS
jgi:molybdopterin-guanine dinucleotide biosynthesis protein A